MSDRRIRKSKQALTAALVELLQQKEFRSISITDIVAVADVNRGTFYKHYTYKEDLLDDLVENVIADLQDSYEEPYRHVTTLIIQELVASAVKIFDHVYKHRSFYQLISNSNALPGFQQRLCKELQNLSLQDYRNKEARNLIIELGINPELYSSYQAYAIWGLIVAWIENDFQHSTHYMSEQLLKILNQQFTFRPTHE